MASSAEYQLSIVSAPRMGKMQVIFCVYVCTEALFVLNYYVDMDTHVCIYHMLCGAFKATILIVIYYIHIRYACTHTCIHTLGNMPKSITYIHSHMHTYKTA